MRGGFDPAESAQVKPLTRMPRRGLQLQHLMWAPVGVEADPVADGTCGVLDAVEALEMGALLLQRPDDTLDHAVLLRAMRRDERQLQSMASDQRHVFPACVDHPAVGPRKELLRHLAGRFEPADQRILQFPGGGGRLAGA